MRETSLGVSWLFLSAAAAKSLQSCPTLCNPIDSSPPGSLIPGILQARTLEWVAISFFVFLSTSPEMPTLEQNCFPELAWPSPSLLPPGGLEDQEVTGAHHHSSSRAHDC